MTESWTAALLRHAARHWPAEQSASLLSEWQAELHTEPRRLHRLRYALSLATARPPRADGRWSPGLHRGLLASALLLTAAALYPEVFILLTGYPSTDTLVRQLVVGLLSWPAAAGLGVLCARWTSGVSWRLPPTLIVVWTFGFPLVLVAAVLTVTSPEPAYVTMALVISAILALCPALFTLAAARQAGPRAAVLLVAGVFVTVGGLLLSSAAFASWFPPLTLTQEPWPVTFARVAIAGPAVHVAMFSSVYALRLIRRQPAVAPAAPEPVTA